MKKSKPKTMEELTKAFEEYAKKNDLGPITKEDFDNTLKTTLKPKAPKDRGK